MYHPNRTEFKRLAKQHNLIPVYREIIADVETPVSAFLKLGESSRSFLLESVEGGERLARFSFLGNDPYLVVTCQNGEVKVIRGGQSEVKTCQDPLQAIKEILSHYNPAKIEELPPFFGGAVGYVGYDAIRYFERIPKQAQDDLALPEMVFFFTDTILIFDHLRHKIKVVANAHVNGDLNAVYDQAVHKIEALVKKLRQPFSSRPLEDVRDGSGGNGFRSNISKEDFLKAVQKAKDYVFAGDVLQVVLSQRFSAEFRAEPFDIYRILRTINPSPYMYYLKNSDLELIGSSPEPLVRVEGDSVMTCPIAGTRPRGKNEEEDVESEQELLTDEKERAEHIMLVDLGRNDLGKVCRPGTVKVENLMAVERYSHVMHLVSRVTGVLEKGRDAFDVLRAVFPAGTVSGAPKIRAMEIIYELEPTLRGPYSGAVGYFSYSGNLDCCITIRTIVAKGKRAYVQAGAGIVADSAPEKEFQETISKAQALISAVQVAERGLVG